MKLKISIKEFCDWAVTIPLIVGTVVSLGMIFQISIIGLDYFL